MSISGFLGRVGVLLAINFLGAITGVAIATGVNNKGVLEAFMTEKNFHKVAEKGSIRRASVVTVVFSASGRMIPEESTFSYVGGINSSRHCVRTAKSGVILEESTCLAITSY